MTTPNTCPKCGQPGHTAVKHNGGSALDLIGHVYGQLTVIKREGTRGESALWLCRCACGAEKVTTSNNLRRGAITSCGCLRRAVDLTGQRFGMLVVEGLQTLTSANERRWRVRCDCGRINFKVTSKLHYQDRCNACMVIRHGHTRGGVNSRTYQIWSGMRKRCENPRCKSWPDYGGRGIHVCERWKLFDNFLADMGPAPEGMSIDRENNDRGYEPGNCRWATRAQQNRNTRACKLEEHEAEQIRWLCSLGYTHTEIGSFFEVSLTTVSRIRKGLQRAA